MCADGVGPRRLYREALPGMVGSLLEYLDGLALREAAVWQKVEEFVNRKQRNAYDNAVDLLKVPKELAVHQDKLSRFEEKLEDLCNQHRRKGALIDQIKRAGLR